MIVCAANQERLLAPRHRGRAGLNPQPSTLNPQTSNLKPQPSTLRSKANREPCSRPDAEAGETDEMQIELTDEILKITFRQFLMYAGVRCGR